MDQALTLELLRSILRTQRAVDEFLASQEGLSIDNPEDRPDLLRLAQEQKKRRTSSKRTRTSVVEQKKQIARVSADWKKNVLYTAKTLALCSLPYEKTSDTNLVRETRLEDGTKIHVKFSAHDPKIGLPYGKDRALITWLMTAARNSNNPRVEFRSALEFFNAFGLASNGHSFHDFRQSMERICNVTITYGYENAAWNADRDRGEKLVFDKNLPLKSDIKAESTGLRSLPGIRDNYYVEFGVRTFEDLVANPVAIPLEILKRYQNSPVAWDFLQMVGYQTAAIEAGTQRAFPLEQVMTFLGSVEKNPRKIKMKLDAILEDLAGYLPGVRLVGRGSSAVLIIEGGKEEIGNSESEPDELDQLDFIPGEVLPEGPIAVSRVPRVSRRLPQLPPAGPKA